MNNAEVVTVVLTAARFLQATLKKAGSFLILSQYQKSYEANCAVFARRKWEAVKLLIIG